MALTLRGIPFGSVINGPGARGFNGEDHQLCQRLPFNLLGTGDKIWWGSTFAAKGVSYLPNRGNVKMREDGITPEEVFLRCIVAKPFSGHMLNAFKLTNPGIVDLLDRGFWRERQEPFFLQVFAQSEDLEGRLKEMEALTGVLHLRLGDFRAPMVAIVINYGCPSVKLRDRDFYEEMRCTFDILGELKRPLVPNFSPVESIEVLCSAAAHPAVDALWIANTVPWGSVGIDWLGIFGSNRSPLLDRGFTNRGGLSGPACLRLTLRKLEEAKWFGLGPLIGGNGIQSLSDAIEVFEAGADAIAIATVRTLRPWRMRDIIDGAKAYDLRRQVV